jgi:hypothetical protein
VDNTLLGVILAVAVAVIIPVVAWGVSQYRQRRLLQASREWLPVEAKIESGALEGTRESGKVVLPTFAFSYEVSGEYYSGRFSLAPKRAFPGGAVLESRQLLMDRLMGRKLLLRYNPEAPEMWLIPDDFIDGWKVQQKIGAHLLHDYSPHD